MEPAKGRSMWPKINMPPLLPPEVNKVAGRPKLCRRKDPKEPKKSEQLSRRGAIMTCSICSETGHNKKGCPNKSSVSYFISYFIVNY